MLTCPTCLCSAPQAGTGPYRVQAANPRDSLGKDAQRVPLEGAMHASGVEFFCCPACKGAFLKHGDLGRVEVVARESGQVLDSASDQFRRSRARAIVAGQSEEERAARDCPACDQPMIEREWGFGSMVYVDVCLDCRGTWLDVGELATIERYFSGRSR